MSEWYEDKESFDEETNRETDFREERSRYGKQKKSHGRTAAAAVIAALALGGAIGGASWVAGTQLGTTAAAAKTPVIETAAPEQLIENKMAALGTTSAVQTQPLRGGIAATEAAGGILLTGAAETLPEAAETEAPVQSEDSQEPATGETQIGTAELDPEEATAVKALDVTEVVEVAMPSVVAITTTAVYESYNNNTFDPFYYFFYGYGNYGNYGNGNQGGNEYQVTGAGSGIIIGDDGNELWIVTNNHVVKDADTLTVSFVDDTTADGTVLGTDPKNDLAVVAVSLSDLSDETKQAIKAVKMGDSDSLRLGETVIAIGNALGLGQSVSTGVVSAVNREITTSEGTKLTTIQTDAAINPGNSGGALLDANGELIGINVAKDAETDVEGMGYAIPISSAKNIIARLTIRRESVSEEEYPYMGVQLQDISSDVASVYRMPEGILVYGLVEDGPAKKAGMLEQDIITGFNGVALTTYEELTNELQYVTGGTEVTVTVQRLESGSYVEKELTMTLGYRKDYQTTQTQNNDASRKNGQDQPSGNDNQQNGQNGQNGFNGWGGFNFGR